MRAIDASRKEAAAFAAAVETLTSEHRAADARAEGLAQVWGGEDAPSLACRYIYLPLFPLDFSLLLMGATVLTRQSVLVFSFSFCFFFPHCSCLPGAILRRQVALLQAELRAARAATTAEAKAAAAARTAATEAAAAARSAAETRAAAEAAAAATEAAGALKALAREHARATAAARSELEGTQVGPVPW